MNKFGAKKTVLDGIRFDSKRESMRYAELKALEGAKIISQLEVRPRFKLTCRGEPLRYETGRQITYTADFRYQCEGKTVVEDVKGRDTRDSRIRRAILEADQGIHVDVIR